MNQTSTEPKESLHMQVSRIVGREVQERAAKEVALRGAAEDDVIMAAADEAVEIVTAVAAEAAVAASENVRKRRGKSRLFRFVEDFRQCAVY